jgi:hypothetical protein
LGLGMPASMQFKTQIANERFPKGGLNAI